MEKNGYIIEPPEPNGSKTAEISLEAKVPKVSTSVVQMEKPYYSSIKNARGSKGVSSNDNWRKKSVMANDEDPERHHAARKNEKKIEFGRKEKVVRCSESRLGEQPSVLLENGIEPNLFSGTEVKNSSSLQSATPSSTSLDIQTNTSSSSRPKKCSNERYVDTSNELFKDTLDDVRLKKRTIIITNIPSDLSAEERKDVETPYVSLLHGGGGTASRWISPSTCFIVFVSEALCQRALDRAVRRHSNTHISWPQLFIDSLEFDTPENVQVIRELYDSIPSSQRDVRVANRMITAALGIRMPRTSAAQKSAVSTSDDRHVKSIATKTDKIKVEHESIFGFEPPSNDVG